METLLAEIVHQLCALSWPPTGRRVRHHCRVRWEQWDRRAAANAGNIDDVGGGGPRTTPGAFQACPLTGNPGSGAKAAGGGRGSAPAAAAG